MIKKTGIKGFIMLDEVLQNTLLMFHPAKMLFKRNVTSEYMSANYYFFHVSEHRELYIK